MTTPAVETTPASEPDGRIARPLWEGSQQRLLIAAMFLLAVALPTAVAYLTLQAYERQEAVESREDAHKLALALTSHFDRTVETIDTLLRGFGPAFATQSPDAIYRQLYGLKLPEGVIQISFVDSAGRFITSNLSPPGRTIDLSDREHVRAHLTNDRADSGIFLSKPVKGRVSGTWSIQFSRALRRDDGTLLGLVVASYEIANFISFYDTLRPGGRSVIALIGDDGVIRASAPPSGQLEGEPAASVFASLRDSGTTSESSSSGADRDGVKRSGQHVHSTRYPFFMLVATEDTFEVDRAGSFRFAVILLAGVFGVALLVFASFGLRYWKLQTALRESELQSRARRREVQVLQTIGRVPGITVLHVENGQATRIGDDGQPGQLARLIAERVADPAFLARAGHNESSSVSIEHFAADGETFEVAVVATPLREAVDPPARDNAEPAPRAVVFAVDETAKRMEENKLYQMSKMAALGELVTGLAHEINQPLGIIRLAANNALNGIQKGRSDGHAREKLERIVRQVERMKAIIDHMRIFGRSSVRTGEPSSAAAAIIGTAQILGTDMRLDSIALTTRGADNDVPLDCAQEQLEQVLINLVLNARDAIRERRREVPDLAGRIEIALSRQRLDGHDQACVTVRDNGGGIPPAIVDKVFQPFFTTKAPGHGTGLGLSVSFGIVRDSGGSISVANEGDGAVFTIRLPAAGGTAASGHAGGAAGGTGR